MNDSALDVTSVVWYNDSIAYHSLLTNRRDDSKSMDIGKIMGNYTFYDGYEGEPQISIAIKDEENVRIHLWDGYFEDIFSNPTLDGTGWIGFTKDYNQLEGAFAENAVCYEIMPEEYLNDLSAYRGKTFAYEETADAVDLICELLQYAIDTGKPVVVTKD